MSRTFPPTVFVALVVCGGCGSNVTRSAPAPVDGNVAQDVPNDNSDGCQDSFNCNETSDGVSRPDNTQDILKATWLVLGSSNNSSLLATAFAISSNRLATNAHVVQGIRDIIVTQGGAAGVVQHESGSSALITKAWMHPDYTGDSVRSPDVGVIEVDGALPSWLRLADDADLRSLIVFDEIRLCGFPGDVALAIEIPALVRAIGGDATFRPRATCLSGQISSLRPFDPSAAATPANTFLIQHDIATSQGTSGSAIFGSSDGVVAVHSAETTNATALNRFAIRADALRDLIEMIDAGAAGSGSIEPPSFCPGLAGTPSSLVDSDGDGFSDAEEFNSTPGSDPCDATDTLVRPRDSDGDGCSDFDERTFPGICDGNPFTPISFPRPIVVEGDRCTILCIQLVQGGTIFCDSDCDGWFDNVETVAGYDSCSPFSPGIPPNAPARVCSDLDALVNGKSHLLYSNPLQTLAKQLNEVKVRK